MPKFVKKIHKTRWVTILGKYSFISGRSPHGEHFAIICSV